jgi:hypothetical protein
MTTEACTTAEQFFVQITKLAHKHEVQYWKDEPGTDAEKLAKILTLAREGLALVREANPKV